MIAEEASVEPVVVSRMFALMPAGHGDGGAGPLRSAISIRGNLEFRHAEVADARGDKCGKTHIALECAWAKL